MHKWKVTGTTSTPIDCFSQRYVSSTGGTESEKFQFTNLLQQSPLELQHHKNDTNLWENYIAEMDVCLKGTIVLQWNVAKTWWKP